MQSLKQKAPTRHANCTTEIAQEKKTLWVKTIFQNDSKLKSCCSLPSSNFSNPSQFKWLCILQHKNERSHFSPPVRIFVHTFSLQKRRITENHVAVAEKKQHAHLPLKKTGFLNNSSIKAQKHPKETRQQ